MANFINYQESKAAMLMLETQQRAIGTKQATTSANGYTSTGEPPSLINIGGARFHQHLPPSNTQAALSKELQQPYHQHYQPQPLHFSNENIQDSPVRKSCSSSLNLVHENPAASSSAAVAGHASTASSDVVDDIFKCGYLRKQKHGHKRFFVLRETSSLGHSRLEYYDSEKKFRNSLRSASAAAGAVAASSPKRVIYLNQCFTVNKRADSKNKYLIALYTKDEYFALVAENEQEQEEWYLALSELMTEGKQGHLDADEQDDGYGTVTPGTVFTEVWQVNVKPKGLGQTKNLTGVYRLCLSAKTLHLMKLNADTPCVNLQLMNIRRCGHSESFFFIEVGRSSSIGPGEVWMQADDSVVAQSMHGTILETMRALKAFEEFRPRSKSQSSGGNPAAFITTRRHLGNLPPSQTGLQRRSRAESSVGTPPSSKSSGYRFRTSSEGEGTMCRPFRSVTGSLSHLNTARIQLGRQEGAGAGAGAGGGHIRAVPGAGYHARSSSLPVSHFPSASSPVSVSGSSGLGSASDTLTRPSSASACGSPSDGGFNSSDEYGSSPGDLRYLRVRSGTPDSLGNTPPIREELGLSDYLAMGWPREEVPDEERSLRRRTHSFSRPAGGVAVYQKMTQTTLSLDECASLSSSLRSDYSSSSEQSQGRPVTKDDGYMPMMCGVAPPGGGGAATDDYVPMQPSTPQMRSADMPTHSSAEAQGYMMMLPGRGSSPALPAPSCGHAPENAEYMDMSGGAGGACSSPADTPPSCSSPYFSLPRSYKAPPLAAHADYVPMCSPAKPSYTAMAAGPATPPPPSSPHGGRTNGCGDAPRADGRVVRPTRLPLSRHSFHGSLRGGEAPVEGPPSPGEPPPSPLHQDYMSMGIDSHPAKGQSPRPSLVAPWNPPSYARPLAAASSSGGVLRRTEGYTEMSFGRREESTSPTVMLQHMCVMDKCYPPLDPPTPQTEPKVIRADSQGRRRHSSETFLSSPRLAAAGGGQSACPSAPGGGPLAEGSKWQSSASFDSVWMCVEGGATPDALAPPIPVASSPMCRLGYQNGLNYIALELGEEPRGGHDAPPSALPANGPYASIDFTKSDGLTAASKD